MLSIMQLLRQDERASAFCTALDLSSLAAVVDSEPDITVFAPSNVAFSRLENAKLQKWFGSPGVLREALGNHLVLGRFEARDLIRTRMVSTFGGGVVYIQAFPDRVKVGEASIEDCDIAASNGILHLVDRVLEPPRPTA